jgi:hypothetical protein
MTGKSVPWKAEGEEKNRMLQYYKKLISGGLIVCGTFLILEHLFTFSGFDLEILGHEWYGFIMIIIAILLSMKWKQLPVMVDVIRKKDIRKILNEGER